MINRYRLSSVLSALVCVILSSTGNSQTVRNTINPFHDAVACWHMDKLTDANGKNPLQIVGNVVIGTKLTGKELSDSIALGGDDTIANMNGGYLDASQGSDGDLNLNGNSLTVAIRLRSTDGAWGKPIFSKHGGHENLVYNLFSFPDKIGFELGTQDHQGMTQVSVEIAKIGPTSWHTIICRYDGTALEMFVDGVMMDAATAHGPLRTGNSEPALIGAERIGGNINSGWRGNIDYVALWNRALTSSEIAGLNGGPRRIAQLSHSYKEIRMLPTRPDLYHETYRPQFHFTARQWSVHKLNPARREEGWVNDPNGLIYLDGQYNFFAQRWNKCWIHAISNDLVHWTEIQPAFWEDNRFEGGTQSGGSVLDEKNSSGLGPDADHPPLIAFWSGNDNNSQCISYSLDRGVTWTKYEHNPVLLHPERDPKVFWYEPDHHWIMVLSGNGSYHFFTSDNLLQWTALPHSVPDSFECPDLFQLPLDGDHNKLKWVLIRGNGKYSIGEFDGKSFKEETQQLSSDSGPNFYATQSWGDVTGQPGRRVQIAWMAEGRYPDMPFNQQMTFPRDFKLVTTPAGPRLFRLPVPEISKLHLVPSITTNHDLSGSTVLPLNKGGDLYHLNLKLEMHAGASLKLHCFGLDVLLSPDQVELNGRKAIVATGVKELEVLVDRTSVEVFVNGGAESLSSCFLPTDATFNLINVSGGTHISELIVWPLKSSWPAHVK